MNIETAETSNTIDIRKIKQNKYATVIVLEIDGTPIVYKKPEITAEAPVFIDKLTFEITSETKNGVTYYTTDGTEPNIKSSIANGQISLSPNGNLTVKAETFINGKPITGVAVRIFNKENPLVPYFDSKPGLIYKYYEGNWDKIPDFTQLNPIKTGTVETFSLNNKIRKSEYGFVFDGFIKVSNTDVYSFFLTSDDGSRLIIDDKILIDNDGSHAMEEKSNTLALSAGYHKISLYYFQGGGNDGLKLEWKPIGKSRTEIDASDLFH